MCLHELSLVDDTMEAIGSPTKYQRLRKWIIRIIIGYFIYIFCQFATSVYINFIRGSNINFVSICKIFFMSYEDFVHISSALIWGTILGLVYL